jgi:hypothetical protein
MFPQFRHYTVKYSIILCLEVVLKVTAASNLGYYHLQENAGSVVIKETGLLRGPVSGYG